MESKLTSVTKRFCLPRVHQVCKQKQKCPPALAALTRPANEFAGLAIKPPLSIPRPLVPEKINQEPVVREKESVEQQQDDWFDQIAISHLSQSLQAVTGFRNNDKGYKGLVEAAAALYRNFNPVQQRQLVTRALERAFPRAILSLIRRLLPQSKFTREVFAAFTTVFFAWLVGPCEVRESELAGRREKNVVHMKKCRFLEETNCVGMCVNLCKMPCQSFIKDSLGMPVEMVPNFDDMSCEMIFGQDPPEAAHDQVLKQPCYKSCNKFKHTTAFLKKTRALSSLH